MSVYTVNILNKKKIGLKELGSTGAEIMDEN